MDDSQRGRVLQEQGSGTGVGEAWSGLSASEPSSLSLLGAEENYSLQHLGDLQKHVSNKLFRITVGSRDGNPDLTVAQARYSLPLACAKDSMDGLPCSFLLFLRAAQTPGSPIRVLEKLFC